MSASTRTDSSSSQPAKVEQIILLVWVHGFKGNQATFADFPDDVCKSAKSRFKGYDVHSVVYPKYRTVGEIEIATHNFVLWLNRYVLDLEREKVDNTGQMAHTTVILLGHSMGGMLVADAAKAVCDDRKKYPERDRADVRGVIAIDTPFIGIHPALVSYGMEQLDAYIEKTLLDTAAFFDNSPRFLKKGMTKIGLNPDKFKPKSTKDKSPGGGRINPDGRLGRGFTNVLSVPGAASSSERDWTREKIGLKGLSKAWSRVSNGSKGSEEDEEGSKRRLVERRSSESSSRSPSIQDDRSALSRSASVRSGTDSIAPRLPPRRISRDHSDQTPMLKEGSTDGVDVDSKVDTGVKKRGEEDHGTGGDSGRSGEKPHRSESDSSHPAPRKDSDEQLPPDTDALVKSLEVSMKDDSEQVPTIPPPTSAPLVSSALAPSASSPAPKVIIESAEHDTASGQVRGDASSKPGLPHAKTEPVISPAPGGSSLPSPPPLPLRKSTSSLTPSQNASASSSSTSLALTEKKKEQPKKDWKWAKEHMEFMSSCWNVGGISRRMKGIEGLQRESGVYFVNIYTIVRPKPPAHPKDRTFVSLPTIHHLTKDNWKPFVHDSAADQVEAHMSLFDRVKNTKYDELIGVMGDEIEVVLQRKSQR